MTMLCLALVVLSQVEAHSVLGHLSYQAKPSSSVLAAKVNIKSEVPTKLAEKVKPASVPTPEKAKATTPVAASVRGAVKVPMPVEAASQTKPGVSVDHAHDKQPFVKRSLSVVHTMLATSGAHAAAKAASVLNIKPNLKDVVSDKKFFGPPFPADYPDDKRPVIQKSILNKLKGPDQPYPALQSKADFDTDFVKDENSDKGSWKAQMEYDTLRQKLAKGQADEKQAEGEAAKEAHDVDDAQAKADAAAKDSADAKKGVDNAEAADADASESDSSKGKDKAPLPSDAEVEKIKKKVVAAEATYEKEVKDFAECEKQLQDAKAQLEDLKAKQADMEKKLADETKLWIDNKSVRLNLKKSRESAAAIKHKDAETRLAAAEKNKIEADERLSLQKFQHEQAQKSLGRERVQVEQARQNLEKATLTLQKIRGYTPAEAAPVKSGVPAVSVTVTMFSMLTMVPTNIF